MHSLGRPVDSLLVPCGLVPIWGSMLGLSFRAPPSYCVPVSPAVLVPSSLALGSQSAPGLGKGQNPLSGYVAEEHSLLTFSAGEEEAEKLYYAAVSSTICKSAFAILAKDLARRSKDGGAYLSYLILIRGHKWPTAAAAAE